MNRLLKINRRKNMKLNNNYIKKERLGMHNPLC